MKSLFRTVLARSTGATALAASILFGVCLPAQAALVQIAFSNVGISSSLPSGFATHITHVNGRFVYDTGAQNVNTDPLTQSMFAKYLALDRFEIEFYNGLTLVSSQRLTGFNNSSGNDALWVYDDNRPTQSDFIIVDLFGRSSTDNGDFDARFAASPSRGVPQPDFLLSAMQFSLQPMVPSTNFIDGLDLPDASEWQSDRVKIVISATMERAGSSNGATAILGFMQSGNNVQVSEVPEPRTPALVLAALAGALSVRGRRRR